MLLFDVKLDFINKDFRHPSPLEKKLMRFKIVLWHKCPDLISLSTGAVMHDCDSFPNSFVLLRQNRWCVLCLYNRCGVDSCTKRKPVHMYQRIIA